VGRGPGSASIPGVNAGARPARPATVKPALALSTMPHAPDRGGSACVQLDNLRSSFTLTALPWERATSPFRFTEISQVTPISDLM
jgi:hypothetical protein